MNRSDPGRPKAADETSSRIPWRKGLAPKLWAAVVLPGIALAAFGGWTDWTLWREGSEADGMARGMDAVVAATELVHQAQRERGFSTGCAADRSGPLCAEAAGQRARTDKAAEAFARIDASGFSAPLAKAADAAKEAMRGLGALRTAASDPKSPPAKVGAGYTAALAVLLDVAPAARIGVADPEISNQTGAVALLERVKENAGQERALGGVMASDKALRDRGRIERFVGLGAVQAEGAAAYAAALSERREAFGKVIAAQDAALRGMRRSLLEDGDVDPKAWSDASTARIDAIRAEIDFIEADNRGDAERAAGEARIRLWIVGSLTVLFGGTSGWAFWWMRRRLSAPLLAMASAMRGVAGGDLSSPVPSTEREDEIGGMARAVDAFRLQGLEVLRMEEESKAAAERAEADRRKALADLAADVERTTSGAFRRLSDAGGSVKAAAGEVGTCVAAVERDVVLISAAAAQSLANAENVAAATEELSASTREIAAQVARGSTASAAAAAAVGEAESAVSDLRARMGGIAEIAAMIGELAAQTNLLALNASIEAQRVGTAGKGFAVVAGAVKELARRSGEEAEGIAEVLKDISALSSKVDGKLSAAVARVREADETSSSIAGAVEEQHAATSEIARAVSQSAQAAGEMSERIAQVASEAAEVERRAGAVPPAIVSMEGDVLALAAALRQALDAVK